MSNKEKIVEEDLESADEFLDIKESKVKPIILIILVIILLSGLIGVGFWQKDKIIVFFNKLVSEKSKEKEEVETKNKDYYLNYRMNGNSFEKFDLYFLKHENQKSNMVYSPLSIKYALIMLKEGSKGNTRDQLNTIVGNYSSKKYNNNNNISFANALFVRDTFKDKVKNEYVDILNNKYNATVIYNSFNNANEMNKWISDKTFKMVSNVVSDENIKDANFYLANALAIDMKWKYFIQCTAKSIQTEDCKWPSYMYAANYDHEKYYNDYISAVDEKSYPTLTFNNIENTKAVKLSASINNYDIIKEVGEETIRKIVGDAYDEWLKTDGKEFQKNPSFDGSGLNRNEYLEKYIKDLGSNYGTNNSSTDFAMYIDDTIKVFGKDLRESDGISLQYVAIMPQKETLENFINNTDTTQITKYINSLKNIKNSNFKEGVITKIKGLFPIFKMDYQLDLMNDLKSLGIQDVFDLEKADLSNITDEKEYIFDATHKTSFEFSTEGIKAASVTSLGGAGGSSGGFQYDFDVPIEEIDITFDKPFLFLIRDKITGEIWFMGTAYEGTNS